MSDYRQFSVKWTNEKELYCTNSLESDSKICCLLSLDTAVLQKFNDLEFESIIIFLTMC